MIFWQHACYLSVQEASQVASVSHFDGSMSEYRLEELDTHRGWDKVAIMYRIEPILDKISHSTYIYSASCPDMRVYFIPYFSRSGFACDKEGPFVAS